ncbi:8456_t:CDS:1, partial [Paraglomus occultum]
SSYNILIKSGIAKITDFGLSNVINQMLSISSDGDYLAYIDPKSFKDKSYRLGMKADIFSLGVILWEISSGRNPCEGRTETQDIVVYRLNGFRDPPFPGTPEEYAMLYSECWNEDSSIRPTCEEVYKRLRYYNELNNLSRLLDIKQNGTTRLKLQKDLYNKLVLGQFDNIITEFNESITKSGEICHVLHDNNDYSAFSNTDISLE